MGRQGSRLHPCPGQSKLLGGHPSGVLLPPPLVHPSCKQGFEAKLGSVPSSLCRPKPTACFDMASSTTSANSSGKLADQSGKDTVLLPSLGPPWPKDIAPDLPEAPWLLGSPPTPIIPSQAFRVAHPSFPPRSARIVPAIKSRGHFLSRPKQGCWPPAS